MTDGSAGGAGNDKLTTRAKLIYGIGDIGFSMAVTAVLFFLLIFYTDAALIAPALAGGALAIGKLWDAVNDPLFGWLSDRTSSKRFGKRRVYMIFGAVPLAFSIMLVWYVPAGLSDTMVFLWIAGSFIIYDTMVTLTSVPYYALSSELTQDYDERASLTTVRMLFGVPSYLVGAALTPVIAGLFAAPRIGYSVVGVVFGIFAAAGLLISAAGIKERPASQTKSTIPPWTSFLYTFKNRPFVQLIIAYLIANLGFVLIQTLLAYFITYQLGMADQLPVVMALLLISIGVFLVPWRMVSDRWNKGPAYAVGLGIGGLAIASTFLLPHEPTPLIYLVTVVAGIGFSANWVFPWSMVPDVVEYDQLTTGEQRGGMYFGVWGFTNKLTAMLGVVISGLVLQFSGYLPNVPQSTETLQAIRLFFGPIPGLILALSLPLLFWYPITRASHAAVRARLKPQG
jgi:GPH family glycoside/pentoside/hexuronide:cation symporter